MNKQVSTFFVACVMALIVLFIYEQLGKTTPLDLPALPEQVADQNTKLVVIAKTPLEQFTRISEAFVEVREVSDQMELPADYTAYTSDVIGKEVLEEIYKGEIITLSRLQDPRETGGGLSGFLGQGERAITIAVDAVSASGGFIQQGDLVDIYARYAMPETGDEKSQIVISNIKVMAVGGDYRRRLRKNPDRKITTQGNRIRVTVAVTPRAANKIKHLGSTTRYGLILKNPKDTQEIETEGWEYSKLLAENVPPEALPTPEKETLRYTVAVIRGIEEVDEELSIAVDEDPSFQ